MRSLAAAALALALAAAAYHRYAAMDYKRDFYLFGAPIQHSCVELLFVGLLPTSASVVLARQPAAGLACAATSELGDANSLDDTQALAAGAQRRL